MSNQQTSTGSTDGHPNPIQRPHTAARAMLLSISIVAALCALYILSLRTFYGLSLPIDGWLDDNQCLGNLFCRPDLLAVNQVGILALLTALLASWGFGRLQAAAPENAPRTVHRSASAVWLTLTAGTLAVLYEASVTLLSDQPPSSIIWLAGIVLLGAGALLWDIHSGISIRATVGNLAVACGILGLILGVATAVAGQSLALPVALGGALLFFFGLAAARHRDRFPDVYDYLLMLFFSLLALGLALVRIWSWRYAFVGDEWGFYEIARDLIHRPQIHLLFSTTDSNGYHSVLSSWVQALVMRLAGENVYGWRLSSILPFTLAVPATYIFARWLAGRPAAIVAAAALAGSHVLLSFSLIPYNNTQALFPLTAGLAAVAFVAQRRSAFRGYLLGLILGAGFLVYGLGRLAVAPIGLLLVLAVWRNSRQLATGMLWAAAGGLASATPLLFNLSNWQSLLKATPVKSEALAESLSVSAQIARNVSAGFLAFLNSSHNTHFVVGPHADLVTALLLIVGIGVAAASRRPRVRAWFWAGITFWALVSAIQQYEWIATTRTFILPAIYAVFAGIGGQALLDVYANDDEKAVVRSRQWSALLTVVFSIVLLNQSHIFQRSYPLLPRSPTALLVRQFQETAAADGGGMPVYIVWDQPYTGRETLILRAYQVDRSRINFISADELLSSEWLCAAGERAQMAIIHERHPEREQLLEHLVGCWAQAEQYTAKAVNGVPWLHRVMSNPGLRQAVLPRSQRASQRLQPDTLNLGPVVDIEIDGAGTLFALNRSAARIERLQAGQRLAALPLIQSTALDMAISQEGLILVAAGRGSDPLVWYDGTGEVVRVLRIGDGIMSAAAIALAADGAIYVSDSERNQIVRLDATGRPLERLTAGGRLRQPASLSLRKDGMLWVYNTGTSEVLLLSEDDTVLAAVPAPATIPAAAPRIASTNNGDLILPLPEEQRIVRIAEDGTLLQLWGGLRRPVAMAVDSENRAWIADPYWSEVARLVVDNTALQTQAAGVVDVDSEVLFAPRPQSPLRQPTSPVQTATAQGDVRYLGASELADLTSPRGIVAVNGAEGPLILVADSATGQLVTTTASGQLLEVVQIAPVRESEVTDLAADSDGRVYVLDARRARLYVVNPDGSLRGELRPEESIGGEARGLTVAPDGTIWIASTRRGDIVQIDQDGIELFSFPVSLSASAQPIDVAVDSSGDIYVVDALSSRLVHFDAAGNELNAWSLPGFNTTDGAHLAVNEAYLYVSLPEQGAILRRSLSSGSEQSWTLDQDGFPRPKPVGIAVDAQGVVWTADSQHGNIISLIPDRNGSASEP